MPSPVPADEFLMVGEQPFTAFGQFGPGRMDKRVFEQDQWWVNVNGEAFLLEDMSVEYRENVVRFLLDGALYFYLGALQRAGASIALDVLMGTEYSQKIPLTDGRVTGAGYDAYTWLEETPLMARLRQLTPSANSLGDLLEEALRGA